MDQSQIFSRRAFVFEQITSPNGTELDLVKKIFLALKNPINIVDTELLDATPSYDIYKASSQTKTYQLKLSFADECPVLYRENASLELIGNSVCPTAIQCGKIKIGENIHFSITSHENANLVADLGRGIVIDHFNSFCNSYKLLQENPKPPNRLGEVIGDYFELSELEKNFIETSIESMESYTSKEKTMQFFADIKKEAASIYDSKIFEKSDFCHGDLTIYNLIERGGLFKMINLDYSHRGNFMLDLSKFLLVLGVKGNTKTQLIKQFSQQTGMKVDEREYSICEKMNLLLILHKLGIEYLYEVYMFDSAREIKICNLINDYSQLFNSFCKLPFFDKYKDFISHTITEPIVGLKAK